MVGTRNVITEHVMAVADGDAMLGGCQVMTMQQVKPDHTRSQQLAVAVLIDSEVIRFGLEAMLGRLPGIDLVPGDFPPLWPAGDAAAHRVLIVAFEQWPQLEGYDQAMNGTRPWVLVVGDEVHSKNAHLHGDLPCDGFMSFTGLTADTLGTVLDRVIAGEMPMPAVLARELLTANRTQLHRQAGPPVALTTREKETLALLAQGFSNKQIARTLGISGHGVKRLVGAVLLKLGAPNRTTAVVTAMNAGLV